MAEDCLAEEGSGVGGGGGGLSCQVQTWCSDPLYDNDRSWNTEVRRPCYYHSDPDPSYDRRSPDPHEG